MGRPTLQSLVFVTTINSDEGYSGVAIYTRNSTCTPIRAEEGITGVLCPPNTTTSFCNLPKSDQIGGYPAITQISGPLDAETIDSEGRCVMIEFPAFVLIGVYSPANRDESRDNFRLGFLNALDARVRNLVAIGKRVFLTGDLNIIKGTIDTANATEYLRKQNLSADEYISTPARRLLNHLLVDGEIVGERDEGRDKPVLWDICRGFHSDRSGMFTCWEQKVNARPGNFGSRIDYVLCSEDWKDWFCESNIQEGLMGSDHCPVYAIIKDIVIDNGTAVDIRDLMNPVGMFKEGKRLRDWTPKDLLPMSARLIPEFDRRRNIRDMFSKKPSLPSAKYSIGTSARSSPADDLDPGLDPVLHPQRRVGQEVIDSTRSVSALSVSPTTFDIDEVSPVARTLQTGVPTTSTTITKRPLAFTSTARSAKRSKAGPFTNSTNYPLRPEKGQSSLMGFFKPKTIISTAANLHLNEDCGESHIPIPHSASEPVSSPPQAARGPCPCATGIDSGIGASESPLSLSAFDPSQQKDVVDPIVAKETWSKLLSKRVAPRCEHNELCISFLTKKPGVNCGRSFYMCPRPLGPSGKKEKGTQWRCGVFIWSSDWTGDCA